MSCGSSDRVTKFLSLAILVISTTIPLLAKGIVVSPSTLYLTTTATEPLQATLTLTPTTAEPTRVRASVHGFLIDSTGQPVRWDVDQFSAGVLLDRSSFELYGNDTLRLTFNLPPGATGSYWSAVILEVEPVKQISGDGIEADIITRVIVPVIVTVAGSVEPAVEMLNAVTTIEKGTLNVAVTVANRGITAVRSRLYAALEQAGPLPPLELSASESGDILLLPGGTRRLKLSLGPATTGPDIEAHFYFPYGRSIATTSIAVSPPE